MAIGLIRLVQEIINVSRASRHSFHFSLTIMAGQRTTPHATPHRQGQIRSTWSLVLVFLPCVMIYVADFRVETSGNVSTQLPRKLQLPQAELRSVCFEPFFFDPHFSHHIFLNSYELIILLRSPYHFFTSTRASYAFNHTSSGAMPCSL